jgi:predicted nicotinamide N-methyase
MVALSAHLADKHLDLRKWTTTHHRAMMMTTSEPSRESMDVELRSRVRAGAGEAGQGCVDWPAGRVLLQWCLDGGVPLAGAQVLEIGAGVGLASIGLAKAAAVNAQAWPRNKTSSHGLLSAGGGTTQSSAPTTVVAADVCPEALENLRINAAKNSILNKDPRVLNGAGSGSGDDNAPQADNSGSLYGPTGLLQVLSWNAAGGASAVAELAAAGVHPETLTHVIGADLAR